MHAWSISHHALLYSLRIESPEYFGLNTSDVKDKTYIQHSDPFCTADGGTVEFEVETSLFNTGFRCVMDAE